MDIHGIDYRTGQPVRLKINGEKFSGVYPMQAGGTDKLPYLAPGLVDLQVNGFAGVDLNTLPVQAADVKKLTQSLWQQGVTVFFPTVITGAEAHIVQALHGIVAACKADSSVERSVGGIHLEGPFISPHDGPRGAHNIAFVGPPDWTLFTRFQDAAEGKIRLITLSPEWPGACTFIEQCVKSGVRVAIGHTAATEQQVRDAVAAGASLSTHLGNAAHQFLPRHANYIWEQLAADELWASLIADGFHLPEAVLKVFLKVKEDKSFLVSDATRFAGMRPGTYASPIGGDVELNEEGRLFVRANPAFLAGSAQSIMFGVNRLLQTKALPLQKAWDMASLKPMEFLTGIRAEAFRSGDPADLVSFHITETGIHLLNTIKSGKIVSN